MIAGSQQRNGVRPASKPSFRMTKLLSVMLFLLAALEPPAHGSMSSGSAIDDMGRRIAAIAQGLSDMTVPKQVARLQFGTICALPVLLPAPATLAGPVAAPIGQADVRQLHCISVLTSLDIGVGALVRMADTSVMRDVPLAVGPSIVAQTSMPFSMSASAPAPVFAAVADAALSAAKLRMPVECGEGRACVERGVFVQHREIFASEPSLRATSTPSLDPLTVRFGVFVLLGLGLLCLLALGGRALYRWRFTPDARLARAARRGLKRGEFRLEYQPVIRIRAGKCAGIEALLRWDNPAFGLREPAHYMSRLEQTKVIGPLTRFMLATAASDFAASGVAKSLHIAVKVSATHMTADNFVSDVQDSAKGILSRLFLEVTENDCAGATPRVLESLETLRKDGVRFALAGAGLATLNFRLLRTFNFELIKMDRQVLTLDSAERVSRLATMAEVARDVGAMLVADGVESAAHHQALRTSRTDLGQSFFYSRALTVVRLEAFLESDGPSRLAG
jgi:EAL domain-containing protein (putative c-di-GMP-specific phosphodiesterase class I)